MPRPVLTKHVREQMAERDITEEQIYAALSHERERKPGRGGAVWVWGLASGRILKVLLSADGQTIITAAWPD
jgi:hypothetical protein